MDARQKNETHAAASPLVRIQQNVLARIERRLLTWLCARLPAWVTPDRLTGLGFAGAIVVFLGYALSPVAPAWLWLSVAGYFIHWFGDSLDGSLARFRRIERPVFGFFLDHSIDAIGTLIAVGGLGFSPFVRVDVALFTVSAYLLLSVHVFIAARVVGEVRLSYLLGGPTELRLLLVAITLAMLVFGAVPVGPMFSAYDLVVGGVGAILVMLFVSQTVTTARRLSLRGE